MDKKQPHPDFIDACNAAQPIGPAADEEGWSEAKPTRPKLECPAEQMMPSDL